MLLQIHEAHGVAVTEARYEPETPEDITWYATPAELRAAGSVDALFGRAPEFPGSLDYMAAFRACQKRMMERNEGPRSLLSDAPHLKQAQPLRWTVGYQVADDEF